MPANPMGRAFSPPMRLNPLTWGVAPGWYEARRWRLSLHIPPIPRDRFGLSARASHLLLKLARTIADLARGERN